MRARHPGFRQSTNCAAPRPHTAECQGFRVSPIGFPVGMQVVPVGENPKNPKKNPPRHPCSTVTFVARHEHRSPAPGRAIMKAKFIFSCLLFTTVNVIEVLPEAVCRLPRHSLRIYSDEPLTLPSALPGGALATASARTGANTAVSCRSQAMLDFDGVSDAGFCCCRMNLLDQQVARQTTEPVQAPSEIRQWISDGTGTGKCTAQSSGSI